MYYEDFEVKVPIATRSRVVTGTDIDIFAGLTHAVNPIFLSDEAARAAGQTARLTPGPLMFSLTIGLCYQAGLFDHVVAMAGVNGMGFLCPVHPGDTISATATPMEKRPARRPDRGVVVLRIELRNQHDTVVLTADVTFLMLTKQSE